MLPSPFVPSQPNRELQDSPRSLGAADTDASIEAWLNVMVRLLHLPDSQRQGIREELEEHLRERVRDLMLGGCAEHEAVSAAIEELGETAQLARRFEQANRPNTRRMLMHLSIVGTAIAAAALGVAVFSPSSAPIHPAVFENAATHPPTTAEQARLSMSIDMNMENLIEAITKVTPLGVSVDWSALESLGLARDTELGISGREMPLLSILELIAQRDSEGSEQLAWRFNGNTLVLNTAEFFDSRELVLVSYPIVRELQSIVEQTGGTAGNAQAQLREVIMHLVRPDAWVDNGGAIGQLHFVGGQMFVQAPPAMHEKIKWILEQLQLHEGQIAPIRESKSATATDPVLPQQRADEQNNESDEWQMARLHLNLERASDNLDLVKSRYEAGQTDKAELIAAEYAVREANLEIGAYASRMGKER